MNEPTPNIVDVSALVSSEKVREWVVSLFKIGTECFARVEGPGFRIQGPTKPELMQAKEWAENYVKEYKNAAIV